MPDTMLVTIAENKMDKNTALAELRERIIRQKNKSTR